MRFLSGLLFFLIFISLPGISQNLCTNGDFDSFTTLPNNYAQVCYANGWTSPSGVCALVVGTGSPDYYNTGGTGGCKPPATWWATVSPHSGAGMEGFAAWYSGNYREYISRQLSSPLTVGQVYTVSLWYTNGVSTIHGYGCNNLGIAFSSTPLTQSGGTPIAYVPQLESSTVLYSTTWQQLSFVYTPTTPDQYITIGNFRNNAATTISLLGTGTTGAYYYVDDISVTPGTSLPVEMISFTAEEKENEIELKWATESETNNSYFSVQHADNEYNFHEIGRIEGAGNSTMLNEYKFIDEHPATDINYYRLQQNDFDGTITYSQTVACRKNKSSAFNWLYQSGSDQLTIIFKDIPGPHQVIHLHSMEGKTIFQSDIIREKEVNISTENIPDGIYALEIEDDDSRSTTKVVLFH